MLCKSLQKHVQKREAEVAQTVQYLSDQITVDLLLVGVEVFTQSRPDLDPTQLPAHRGQPQPFGAEETKNEWSHVSNTLYVLMRLRLINLLAPE